MTISKVCVTGASGKAGQAMVQDLSAHGFQVLAVDIEPADLKVPFVRADLCDYGETVEILSQVEAVVHLANIPAPGLRTAAVTFTRNTAMNSNVFLGAVQVGLERVVWASSETTLGLPFDTPPRYVPIDEDHYPYPTSTYALSKVVGETVAAHVSEWSGIPIIGLRLSNIFTVADYEAVPGYWTEPTSRKWNLWGYIDVRDVAEAFRKALEAPLSGAHNFIIAAADTIMNRPSKELMDTTFPGVPWNRTVGEFETLLAVDRARSSLGFEPQHTWRNHVVAG